MKKVNVGTLVDQYGAISAEIAALQEKANVVREQIAKNGDGAYEGDLFRATVSSYTRATPDKDLRLAIEALVKANLSKQYVTAHTNKTPVVTVKAVAKKRGVVTLRVAA